MENTNFNQFKDDQPSFFLASGESFVGPFRPSEIFSKLQSKEVSWVDHCYRELEGKWMRISEHPVFQSLQPEPPKPKPPTASAPPPPPLSKDKPAETKWFLFQGETQTGPYGAGEIKRLLALRQISDQAFVWQEAFTEWKAISELAEFKFPQGTEKTEAPKSSDRRSSPRKPLVAQIYMTNQKEVVLAICRDVSVGGMQVLTDHIPGVPGDKIQLNVLPPASSGLKPFVAEGVLVRILEDQRGFSFRFTQLSNEAKKSIESYVS